VIGKHELASAARVVPQIVMNDEGNIASGQKLDIVLIEIVSRKDRAFAPGLGEGFQYGAIAAADRVNCANVRFLFQRIANEQFCRAIDAETFGDPRDGKPGKSLGEHIAESLFALVFTGKEPARQCHQHLARPPSRHAPEQIGRRRTRHPVVHADIANPGACRQIGHQRDDRNFCRHELGSKLGNRRRRSGLQDDTMAPAPAYGVQDGQQFLLAHRLGDVKSCGKRSGTHAGQFGLECFAYRRGKALRRVHHDIDDEAPPGEARL
jgi:hypothetical protein